jgi:hypothetical protein
MPTLSSNRNVTIFLKSSKLRVNFAKHNNKKTGVASGAAQG